MKRIILGLAAAVGLVLFTATAVVADGDHKEVICHPDGSGKYVHIDVDKHSSHFADDGTPKHVFDDGRADFYSESGACPGDPAPTVTVTASPTVTVTVPGSTATVTLDDVVVEVPGATTTRTGDDVVIDVPGNTTTRTGDDVVVDVPGATTTVTVPGQTTTVTAEPVVHRQAAKQLAFTGSDFQSPVTLSLFVLLLGLLAWAGSALLRRRGQH